MWMTVIRNNILSTKEMREFHVIYTCSTISQCAKYGWVICCFSIIGFLEIKTFLNNSGNTKITNSHELSV